MAVPAGSGDENEDTNRNGSAIGGNIGASGGQMGVQQSVRQRLRLQFSQPAPTSDATVEEGYHLFNGFLHDELSRANLLSEIDRYELPPIEIPTNHVTIPFASPLPDYSAPQNYSRGSVGTTYSQASTSQSTGLISAQPSSPHSGQYRQVGRSIRELADEFSKSKQGQQVKALADQVDFGNMNASYFFDLMSGVFYDGKFSVNSVVALFVFCSSLLIKALKNKAVKILRNIINWCFTYIKDKVCVQVQEQGGWNAVVGSMTGFIVKAGATAGLTILFAIAAFYIWRK